MQRLVSLSCAEPATVQRVLLPDFDHVVRKEEHNSERPRSVQEWVCTVDVASINHRQTQTLTQQLLIVETKAVYVYPFKTDTPCLHRSSTLFCMATAEPHAVAQTEA